MLVRYFNFFYLGINFMFCCLVTFFSEEVKVLVNFFSFNDFHVNDVNLFMIIANYRIFQCFCCGFFFRVVVFVLGVLVEDVGVFDRLFLKNLSLMVYNHFLKYFHFNNLPNKLARYFIFF